MRFSGEIVSEVLLHRKRDHAGGQRCTSNHTSCQHRNNGRFRPPICLFSTNKSREFRFPRNIVTLVQSPRAPFPLPPLPDKLTSL